ncbi:MAG: DUF2789 domain-containing protein [Methylophilus sp.]|jgi:hypothetical protein
MDLSSHQLSNLFDQLGLDSEPNAIAAFVKEHSPLASNILLADAKFWTDSQASFLREEILKDSDWAEVIDQLNEILHAKN